MKRLLVLLATTILGISSPSLWANDLYVGAWQFDVAPYLWAINMNGRVQNGPLTTHISEDFADIMRQFDGGGMLWVDAHNGPFGIFINSLYTVLSDHGHIRRFDASMKTKFGIFAGGVSYILFRKQFFDAQVPGCHQFQIEPYIGARYTFNDVRLRLGRFAFKSDHNWTDPIIGLRLRYDFNPQWNALLAGDIGGTSRNSQHSYNVIALLGYHPAAHQLEHVRLYAGYRNLYQVYETGTGFRFFRWNMRLFGPVLGINFAF